VPPRPDGRGHRFAADPRCSTDLDWMRELGMRHHLQRNLFAAVLLLQGGSVVSSEAPHLFAPWVSGRRRYWWAGHVDRERPLRRVLLGARHRD